MNYNNLSKLFKFVSEDGTTIIFDYEHGFLINKPKGIDVISTTLKETSGISQVGTTVISAQIKSRPITISGITMADRYKDRLIEAFRPATHGTLYADDWSIGVVIKESPTIADTPDVAKFQISLLAPYPYWTYKNTVSYFLLGASYGFKFPWNISRPYFFGNKIETLYVDVKNTGYVESGYTVKMRVLSGSPTWFMLENMDTNEFLKIEKQMVSGEYITIECGNGSYSVESNVDGDITGSVTIGSNLFNLHVGSNYLKSTSDIDISNFECEIQSKKEIAGITL